MRLLFQVNCRKRYCVKNWRNNFQSQHGYYVNSRCNTPCSLCSRRPQDTSLLYFCLFQSCWFFFFRSLGESISLASWAQPISSSATYPLCLACGIDSGGLTALFSDGPAWAGTRWHFLTVLIRFWFAFQKVDCASSVNLISTHLSIENLNIDLDRPDYFASVRFLVCDGQHFLQR